MRVVGGSRAWRAAALSILLAPLALGLAPLFSDSIIEAPSHEIFSPSRLRLEHNRRNRASGALEASGALTDGALPVACPSNCSYPEGGFCDAGSGVCFCNRGWIGSACGEELGCLVEDCSGHGACIRGRCQCQLGYHGAACEEDACPLHCHASAGRGLCVHGTCACAEGWSGASCSQRPTRDCPVDSRGLVCSGHGSCGADGSCMCHHSDHSGLDCSYRSPSAPPAMGSCLRDGGGKLCGGASRGRCELDAHPPGCRCLPGFSGAACASDDCFTGNAEAAAAAAGVPSRPWGAAAAAVPCGGHGSCRAVGGGTDRWYCQCERGFVGPDCGEGDATSCPRSCSGHGDCNLQPVAAPPLSLAKQIAITAARLAAVGAGVKANATALASLLGPASMAPRCTCHRGWEGVDCSAPQRCPELHAVHDYGPSADPATCQPHTPCCGHGLCVLGECKCEAGYHDAACARYEGVAP